MDNATGAAPMAALFGLGGVSLTPDEAAFFREANPLGFILFARNCDTPDQVRALTESLRDCVGRAEAPILIDQEGGRVRRLMPPHWWEAPAIGRIAALDRVDPPAATEAAWLQARRIAADLEPLGIDVDCAPVCDLALPGAHAIIGDRAYGSAPASVSRLARAACEGLLAGGVLPVIKHLPGHGRAQVDSHDSLPRVETPASTLEATDFQPFKALSDMPWGMTAHIVYDAIDSRAPATTSPTVIAGVIRDQLGFDGLLLSDDLSMGALTGSLGSRTAAALAAGCDVALHCNGDGAEMRAVAETAPLLGSQAMQRFARGRARLLPPTAWDRAEGEVRLATLLARAIA